MSAPLRRLATGIFFVGLLLTAACSTPGPVSPTGGAYPAENTAAEGLLRGIEMENSALKTLKGIGRVRIQTAAGTRHVRAAWIGSLPEKIHIRLMAVSGQAVGSIASDGQVLYILAADRGRLYRKPAHQTDLKRIVAIPLKAGEVLALLAGRVPIVSHQRLSLAQTPAGTVLTLTTRGGRVRERIVVDTATGRARGVEVFDRGGESAYRVTFDSRRESAGFWIPTALTVSGADGARVQVTVDRYWTDVPIKADAFVLTAPPANG